MSNPSQKQTELRLEPRPKASRINRAAIPTQSMRQYRQHLQISGMRCASCAQNIQRGLGLLHSDMTSDVNFATNRLTIQSASPIQTDAIIQQIHDMGYAATAHSPAVQNEGSPQLEPLFMSILLAVMFLIGMISNTMHWTNPWNIAVTVLMASIAQSYLGESYYRSFWKNLKSGQFNMDSLIAIGTSAAFGLSLFQLPWASLLSDPQAWLAPAGHNFFEASVFVLCFVHIGQWLESRISRGLRRNLSDLANMLGHSAKIEIGGTVKIIPFNAIAVDHIVIVEPGGRIPVDGTIISGQSDIDESAMTGEPLPVLRDMHDTVYAGTINVTHVIKIRAEQVGDQTRIGYIRDMVENAASQKPPIARKVDEICGYFVPGVLIFAAMTFVLWAGYDLSMSRDMSRAILNAVAVLVIACPCALGLATPMVVIATIAKSAASGILIKDAAVLENLEHIDYVVLDKTGTLTIGRPAVTDIIPVNKDADHMLRLASSAVCNSHHPIAKAIAKIIADKNLATIPASNTQEIPGQGLIADIQTAKPSSDPFVAPEFVAQRVYVGNRRLLNAAFFDLSQLDAMAQELALDGKSIIYVGIEQPHAGTPKSLQVIGLIALNDELRPGIYEFIQSLYNKNLGVMLLTGDNKSAAMRVAQKIGIDDVQADIIPEEKAGRVMSLRQRGRKVLMLGDGINDAAAIANADIGIAIAGGSDLAMNSAHVGFMQSNPAQLLRLFELGELFRRKIKQNLVWAFGFNIIGIPIAAIGLLHPGLAGAAMAFSSIFVVGNAAKIMWPEKSAHSNPYQNQRKK